MFTSGFVLFNFRSCAVGVSWQLWPTSGCNIATEETVKGENSLPLSVVTVSAAENRTVVTPRYPDTSSRLPQDECRCSQGPGQLGAEAHHGDPPPAVRSRRAALRHRRRGQGRHPQPGLYRNLLWCFENNQGLEKAPNYSVYSDLISGCHQCVWLNPSSSSPLSELMEV